MRIATLGPIGHVPFAPGTIAAAIALPVSLATVHIGGPLLQIAVGLALLGIGVRAVDEILGKTSTPPEEPLRHPDEEHPPVVVIGAAAGLFVTLTLSTPNGWFALLGLGLFRGMALLRPVGIGELAALPGGLGVMLPDFAAGVVANIFLRLLTELPVTP